MSVRITKFTANLDGKFYFENCSMTFLKLKNVHTKTLLIFGDIIPRHNRPNL